MYLLAECAGIDLPANGDDNIEHSRGSYNEVRFRLFVHGFQMKAHVGEEGLRFLKIHPYHIRFKPPK